MTTVSQKLIAQKAGINQSEVSRVLNNKPTWLSEEKKERILQIARDLDYQPNYLASSLKTGKRNCIGVAGSSSLSGMGDLAISRIFAGIGEAADANHNSLVMLPADLDSFNDMMFKAVKGNMVDGLVLFAYTNQYDFIKRSTIPQLKKQGTPFVFIHFTTEEFDCPNAGFNMPQAGYEVTRHLLDQGYTDIACIDSINIYNNEFLAGYQKACAGAGITPVNYTSDMYHTIAEHGYTFGQKLIADGELHRAYAVFSDKFAYGLMKAVREAGRNIPDDIAITGIGNLITTEYQYSDLTTIDLKYEERGRRAADMLFSLIGKKKPERQQWLAEPELVIRISSGNMRTA